MIKETLVVKYQTNWQVLGEWLVAEGSQLAVRGQELPSFVARTRVGFTDLLVKGTDELPVDMVGWMKTQMEEEALPDDTKPAAFMHTAFTGVFPIPNLPAEVSPIFSQWRIIETPLNPNKKVVVQPVVFTAQKRTPVFASRTVESKTYVPPVDPFIIATLNLKNEGEQIPLSERGHLRELIKSFWSSLADANSKLGEARRLAIVGGRRLAAEKALAMMDEGASSISDVAKRMVFYVLSQEPSPLSRRSRAIIQLPWVFKAAEAWMQPISELAHAGNVEFPGI
jgi:hypothetical protein